MKSAFKKIGILVGIIAIMFCIVNVHSLTVHAMSTTDAIKKKINSQLNNGDVIKKIYYYDYDKNGRKEAFVITGEKASDEYIADNTLWFAYKNNNKIYTKKVSTDIIMQSKVLKLKSVTLFAAAKFNPTTIPEDLYLVKGNSIKKIFYGNNISKLDGNNFTSIQSTYDLGIFDGLKMGRTWKPYYFYYKNGKVYEYTAKNISQTQFKQKYSNTSTMLNKYKKLGKVKSILVRLNNLVHINYLNGNSKNCSYNYVTFKVNNKKLTNAKTGEGIYNQKLK